jgi:hypothetical protein
MHTSRTTQVYRPRESLLNEPALCAWFGTASPGDRIEYWRGFLAIDAGASQSSLQPEDRRRLGRVAARAFRLAEQGKAHLVQRRHGPNDYSYLLIVRPQPRSARARFATAVLGTATRSRTANPHRIKEAA